MYLSVYQDVYLSGVYQAVYLSGVYQAGYTSQCVPGWVYLFGRMVHIVDSSLGEWCTLLTVLWEKQGITRRREGLILSSEKRNNDAQE